MQANLTWHGREVLDVDGRRIGRLEEVYLDDATDQPRWAAVSEGPIAHGLSLVPLANAKMRADHVAVAVTAGVVDEAPHIDSGRELTEQEAASLARHYTDATKASKASAAPGRR